MNLENSRGFLCCISNSFININCIVSICNFFNYFGLLAMINSFKSSVPINSSPSTTNNGSMIVVSLFELVFIIFYIHSSINCYKVCLDNSSDFICFNFFDIFKLCLFFWVKFRDDIIYIFIIKFA